MLVAADRAWEAVCALKTIMMCTRKAMEWVLSGLVPLSGTWGRDWGRKGVVGEPKGIE